MLRDSCSHAARSAESVAQLAWVVATLHPLDIVPRLVVVQLGCTTGTSSRRSRVGQRIGAAVNLHQCFLSSQLITDHAGELRNSVTGSDRGKVTD